MGSNSGLHRYSQGEWVENGAEEGLAGASVRAFAKTRRAIWAATTHGSTCFFPNGTLIHPKQSFKCARAGKEPGRRHNR